jgi:hypothetical protein
MLEYTEVAPLLKLRQQHEGESLEISIEDLCEMEMQVGLAKMHRRLETERRSQSLQFILGFWPLVMGFLLAAIAPALCEVLAAFKPWGMGLIFPFAVLSSRPELHLSGSTAGVLQSLALYGQFPIEALLAKIACRNRVTFFGVVTRMAGFNLMAVTLLVLLNTAI